MKYLLKFSFHATVAYTVRNSSRECDDCIAYDPALDEYYLTFTHGGEDGSLALQIDDRKYSVTPDTLRDTLETFGVKIPRDKRIVIFPCYPVQVTRKYAHELVQNRIIIQGDWNVITGIGSKITDNNRVHISIGKVVEETPY